MRITRLAWIAGQPSLSKTIILAINKSRNSYGQAGGARGGRAWLRGAGTCGTAPLPSQVRGPQASGLLRPAAADGLREAGSPLRRVALLLDGGGAQVVKQLGLPG
jgi:hypothetical protein